MSRGGLSSRGGLKRRGQTYPFPRGLNRPSRESRPNPVQTAPWTQPAYQSFDLTPQPSSDVFGAFSENEQAKFLSNSTSYPPSTEYTNQPTEYDGFFPKRFRADDRSDDYYPPPPSSFDWQHQPEPYFDSQPSSQYADPACKWSGSLKITPPSLTPIVDYPPNPPLPNYGASSLARLHRSSMVVSF